MRFKVLSFWGKIDKADYVRSAIFAALYAIMKDICIDLNDDKTLDFNLSSIKYIIIYFIISYIVSLCIFNLIKILSKHFIVENSETSFSLKSYFIATLRNLLFWIPYYILLFPGTSNLGDTNKQIQMFFHRPIKFPLNVSPVQGPDIYITDHHPLMTTVTYYGDEITEEEKEAIDAILPYDSLSKRYDAILTDPVKKKFNQNATSEQLNNYYKCWFSM